MVNELLRFGQLTQGSLQNVRDLITMRHALGIEATTIPDVRITDLASFLTARNQVAHDLDIKDPADQSWGSATGDVSHGRWAM